jgi:hypothetical protein
MLVGYVSDEDFVAVAGALLELQAPDGTAHQAVSSASGAVRLDLAPGDYRAVVACPGYGTKLTRVRIDGGPPAQIRLVRSRLLGYVWPKAVRAGDRYELRVSSPQPYRSELWRYGAAREFVGHLGHGEHPPGATAQVTPDGDYAGGGVGWNQSGLSLGPGLSAPPRLLSAPQRSGLYAVHVRARDGSVITCPWVVAPARPAADIAVLASDITWNAYNAFGGRSNYLHSGGLPPAPDVNRRQTLPRYTTAGYEEWGRDDYPPLSFDRPEPENQIPLDERIDDPITWRDACSMAAADWRLLGWLERAGFPVDVYAETQLARGELELSRYRVLVLGAHPEYWTVGMYDRVKAWVHDSGGRLVYLGGNGINCAVAMHDDASMTVLNGNAAVLEPRRAEVESRFGLVHEPEARLLGVGYTRAGLFTAAPYEVLRPEHWAFAGTGVHAGDLIGTRTLGTRFPAGASGHETDKVSPNSPATVTVLARGRNPHDGGAELAIYHTGSGGAVFAAGSINFVGALPVDGVLDRLLRNVLTRVLTRTPTDLRRDRTPTDLREEQLMDPDSLLDTARVGAPRPTGSRPAVAAATGPLDGVLRLSGQIAVRGGELMATGKVGAQIDLDLARACARQCAVNLLDVARQRLGGLSGIRAVARLRVYVASDPNFTDQHLVADAATDLLHEVFGAVPHVRTALGVAALPRDSPVEIDADLILGVPAAGGTGE